MRSECIQAVTEAAAKAGRALTSGDFRGIEQRITQALRDNARENPDAFQKLTRSQQIAQAAERAAKDIESDKQRAVANVARQIIAHDRNQSFVDELAARGQRRIDAVQRLIVGTQDNRSGAASLEQNREGIARQYKAGLEPIAKATQKFLGFWTNRGAVRDVVRELFGEDTGNAQAKNVASIWRDQIAEPMRQHFNELGGNIRKLGNWAVPQEHSQWKVAKADVGDWIDFTLQRLDRSQYRNADGSLMTDVQMRAMLGDVRQTIATDGAWNTSPGEGGGSGVKNRGDDRRVLHFKNADSYLDYQQRFGERSILESMNGHIDSMARNIAALQTFGPNAEAGFKALLDDAAKRDSAANMPANKVKTARELTETMFALGAGKLGSAGDPKVAHRFQTIKSVIAAARLGSASLSAITDSANIVAIARAWNMPAYANWAKWESKAWASAEFRQFMRSQGVGVEAVTHSISRYGEETFGHGMASTVANTIFRLSGLNFIDNVRRTATGAMLYSRIGDLLREHATLDAANPADVARLADAGTTAKTWEVWRRAELDDTYGITPQAIAQIPDEKLADLGNPRQLRRDAMQQLVGAVNRDVDTIVPMMTDKVRAKSENTLKGLRGSVAGELVRSVLQFKSFPLAMISNHWQRLQSLPTPGGKALYAAELLATSTILGALSIQMKSLVAGNNPQDMTDPKFAGRAVTQGGALGLYGDLLIGLWASPYKEKLTDQMGPLIGGATDIYDLARAAWKSVEDPSAKENLGGDVTRFLRGNTPGASLWYAKAALDHLIFQRLQDYYSPGYAQRQQQRVQKFYGSGQWWPSSTASTITAPQQPNLSSAIGSGQ